MTLQLQPRHIILYAEDDEDDRMLLQETFQRFYTSVKLACVHDGRKAIAYLESLNVIEPEPCLIILDINMPLMDGREALQQIRNMERFKDVPVVMFSTSSQISDKEFAAKYDAAFITKPIDFNQMNFIVDVFINHCSENVQKSIRSN